MSTLMPVPQQPNQLTPDQVSLLKRTICRDATDDELKLFMHVCQRTGLDPFARQIYAVKRLDNKTGKASMVVQTSIDGFRLAAARSGSYAGSDDPVFDNEDEPKRATVTVYKMVQGQRCPFTATARWREYYPGDKGGFMWNKMPCVMLAKVAEALALRKAFPADQAGEPNRGSVTPDQPPEGDGIQEAGVVIPYGPLAKQLVHKADPVKLRAYILEQEAKWKLRGLKEPPNWAREMIAAAEPIIAEFENREPEQEG
jgi:phage recombination protein Bet